MKSKILSRTEPNAWNNPKGGVIYYRTYTLEDGNSVNLGAKDEDPKWGQVGAEIEYEEAGTDSKGNPKYRRTPPQSGFTKKPVMQSIKQTKRISRSNALHALAVVNSTYEREVLTSKDLAEIEKFTVGDITGDIEKFSEAGDNHTSRLSAVNNATLIAGYKPVGNITEFMKIVTAAYGYIVG